MAFGSLKKDDFTLVAKAIIKCSEGQNGPSIVWIHNVSPHMPHENTKAF